MPSTILHSGWRYQSPPKTIRTTVLPRLGRTVTRVRHSARNLTDGGGLVLVRKLFDRFALAGWIDRRAEKEKGFCRPGLMAEVWIALLLYGGRVMDDLPLLERRGVRRIFGWIRVPDPTTFGRWLRRAG